MMKTPQSIHWLHFTYMHENWLVDNRYTGDAITVVNHSVERTLRRGIRGLVGPIIILWSMLRWEACCGTHILTYCGVNLWKLQRDVDAALEGSSDTDEDGDIDWSLVSRTVFLAFAESQAIQHDYAGTEHIILALLKQEVASIDAIRAKYPLSYEACRHALLEQLGSGQ